MNGIYIPDMKMPECGYRTIEICYDANGYPMALADGGEAFDVIPAADVRPVVYCKDCIHRPYETVPGVRYGLTVESPDSVYKCPCFCDGDGWYSWIPDDDFFCANGERLREGGQP